MDLPSPPSMAAYTKPRCTAFFDRLAAEHGARPLREWLGVNAGPADSMVSLKQFAPGTCELTLLLANGTFWLHSASTRTDRHHRSLFAGRDPASLEELKHFERVPVALELLHGLSDPAV